MNDQQRAMPEWFVELYDALRSIADRQLKSEGPNQTIQPTALVNEVYLRLAARTRVDWPSRPYLFAAAAREMRRILVDRARSKGSARRGGGHRRVGLVVDSLSDDAKGAVDVLALEDAMERLATASPRAAQVVELRFYGGLSVDEAADILEVSPRTVELDWRFARAWLTQRLTEEMS